MRKRIIDIIVISVVFVCSALSVMNIYAIEDFNDNADIIVDSIKLSEEKKNQLIKTFDLKVIEYNKADYDSSWIESFDVSQKEVIAIAFNNSTVLIVDEYFNVKYVLAFNTLEHEDLFYVNWIGDDLEIIFYRSNYSFTINPNAKLTDVSEKNEQDDGLRKIAQRKSDTVNNTTYKIKTSSVMMALSGSYDMLVRTESNGEEILLFKSDKNIPIGMITWFFVVIVGGAVVALTQGKVCRRQGRVSEV